jgi:thiamine monophosphate synthase
MSLLPRLLLCPWVIMGLLTLTVVELSAACGGVCAVRAVTRSEQFVQRSTG